ncbi:MAG: 2-phospho-L-lactate guanylyltransferase [Proteobacteria bacterium]|jgi:2-phospho-L-lactate guanylyltransferase|nr:2-phospho-L-lactate guanylyltransferase [Pseudomonadota bacterium]MDA1299214.1 2-phospho-L-lactate guanylyltransferase [Pseudomonadota bacterium]
MTVCAVIPIKQLGNAKQRLSGLLAAGERTALFRAMVEDVLIAVEACTLIDEIMIVTDDPEVADLAGGFGARIVPEPDKPGLIEAVTAASALLAAEGARALVFLPGDVPLVTPEELEVVLDGFGRSADSEMTIVPASDLGGSNCVACSPPDAITFGFGEDSFRRHVRLAEDRGIVPTVARLPGIGLDVDTPDDLLALADMMTNVDASLKSTAGTKVTYRYLIESGIVDRMTSGNQMLNV